MKISFHLFLSVFLFFKFFFVHSISFAVDESNNKASEEKKEIFDVKASEKKGGVDITKEITNQSINALKKVWDAFKWEDFKKKFKTEYESQIVGYTAKIKKGVELTKRGAIDPKTKEGIYLSKRMDIAFKAFKGFSGISLDDKDEMPRIGCAFSGGGYRAMILTSGYLKALEDLKLIDSILYISTLSGSTWYLGPWTYQQDPSINKVTTITAFNQMLINKIQNNRINLLSPNYAKDFDAKLFASEVIWPKILFDQIISSVDIYGANLAHHLLTDQDNTRQLQRLSSQIKNVEMGNHPWPIYTAVSMHKTGNDYRYNWYEFNPIEVRNLELDYSIPSYSFGRKFDNGKSIDFPPGQSFGFLMGIFGSAYTVNLQDVIRIMFGGSAKTEGEMLAKWYGKPLDWANKGLKELTDVFGLAKKGKFKDIWNKIKDDLNRIKGSLLAEFLGFVSDVTIKLSDRTVKVGGKEIKLRSARFAPAQVFNPFKNFTEVNQQWLQDKDYLTFIDAGISYNIPLRPLFRPERDLDVIIVGDASGNVPDGPIQLDLALADIKRFYGLDYKKDENRSDKNMMIYEPVQNTYPNVDERLKEVRPPIIVYFNFIKDINLFDKASKDPALKKLIDDNNLKAFDAKACLSKEYCSTYNFAYSVADYKQLSGIGEFNIRAHESILKDIVEQRTDLRIEDPEFGGEFLG